MSPLPRYCLAVIFLLCSAAPYAQDLPRYAVNTYRPDGGTLWSVGLSNNGELVGTFWADSQGSPWPGYVVSGGQLHALASLAGNELYIGNVNNAGTITGSVTYEAGQRPYIYRNGTMSFLSVPANSDAHAEDINENGAISGSILPRGGATRSAMIYRDGNITTFDLPGANDNRAYRINAAGQAVGASYFGDRTYHALYWDGSRAADLNQPGWSSSVAHAINDQGDIVGSFTTGGASVGFLYHEGAVTVLPELDGGHFIPRDVNNSGDMVGTILGDGGLEAALFRAGHLYRLRDLVDPGALSDSFWPDFLDDHGDIAGGTNTLYEDTLILLTPLAAVPEPASAALLCAGLLVIARGARRAS